MKVKDHSVSGKTFSLRYDENHHMCFTEPKPNEQELPSYYQSEDYISHTDGARTLFEKLYQIVKNITLSRKQKLLKSYLGSKGSVLDIGSGTGDFLKYLQENNWCVSGMEPNEQARSLSLEKGVQVKSSLKEVEGSFDNITMWHVLEHVYDLEQQINWLKEHLSKQGFLYVAVPNFESLDAQIYKEHWAAYDVPRHLYHFSQRSIQAIFEKHGLEVVGKHPMKFDAYYVSLLSEKYKRGKMNFIRAFVNGWKSNWSARETGQYSSLIYVITHKKV